MKIKNLFFPVVLFTISLFMLFITACEDNKTNPDTTLPTVAITYPVNNSYFTLGSVIMITAEATDNKGIKEVQFYIDDSMVATDEEEPYQYEWDTGNSRDTTHTIYARAYDTSDNSATSEIIEITLGNSGTVTDIDGNVYQTLIIGDQEWMIENLKVIHYNNGDPVPNIEDDDDWINTTSGAYCVYDNDPSNVDTYGNLYNWYAVDDPRGLAPEGWHVPTDEEIMELEMYLGMSYEEAHDTGYRGTNEGSKLAGRADLWYDGGLENDPEFGSSGFDFLPGGYRGGSNGHFYNLSYYGYFWSSTEYGSYGAWFRRLNYDNADVLRYYYDKRNGFSVRCVRSVE
ncbi:MAG: hypothetical protein APR54_08620 [Candidatus Cloacimonas sp. SDB]|nr:MAG: hypothetical protein APR54_08620 [Candidatus Cloacimonas sp. SDB]